MKKTINCGYGFFLFIFLVLTFYQHTSAQQVISSAGTNSIGTDVQLSWTLGETVTESLTGPNFILTQGFHQGNLKVTAIGINPNAGFLISVYPNPVLSELILEVSTSGNPNLSYQLFDLEGKLIISQKVENFPEIINMNIYSSGTYLLKIIRNGKEMFPKFKVLKD
ncbi:MAG: T9SS type A sorting domain-containing protein [Draconibacterium sp.]|nr:T9SS type A sorting domain-containing protein [Draconibacterium sp.]